MAVGPEIETRGHLSGFREEIAKVAADRDRFFTWFNGGRSADEAIAWGQRDFDYHIWRYLQPIVPETKRRAVLEIGHGGGRLLAAAANYFDQVIGVDIHGQNQLVAQELKNRRVSRCVLHQVDEPVVPLADDSVDAAYSFIVFQHVERIDIFTRYLQEVQRVLRPGGAAILYFGRQTYFSANASARWICQVDQTIERWWSPTYRELPARVNCVNLVIAHAHACRLAQDTGFQVVGSDYSTQLRADGRLRYKGQVGLLVQKPWPKIVAKAA